MAFKDMVRNILSRSDQDYYDDTDDDVMDDYDMGVSTTSTARQRTPSYTSSSKRQNHETTNNVVNIHTTAQLQVVLVKPEAFDEATEIADHLNDKRTVVLNLEAASRDTARRLVDFLSGVAYANDGSLKRVANSTFIITPYNVSVMGDLLDELESNGVYF